MQHVHGLFELDGVRSPVRVSIKIVHDLQHARATETFQRLRKRRLQPNLRVPQRTADAPLHIVWKRAEIVLAASDPTNRLWLLLFSLDVLSHATTSVYAIYGITGRRLRISLESSGSVSASDVAGRCRRTFGSTNAAGNEALITLHVIF